MAIMILCYKEAVLPGRNDAEMGPANSLHASALYNEYYKRFDLTMILSLSISIIIIITNSLHASALYSEYNKRLDLTMILSPQKALFFAFFNKTQANTQQVLPMHRGANLC